MSQHVISLLILIPLAAALLLLVLPSGKKNTFQWIALVTGFLQLGLLLCLWKNYAASAIDDTPFQFIERSTWFEVAMQNNTFLRAEYFVGLDGLSLPLISLSILILLITVIASFGIQHKRKGYFVLLMVLNAAIIGSFCALDFLLFFLFFEFMLLPLYFLIGIWGGPRREYASIKFFLYTFLGSILILVAIIMLHLSVQAPGESALVHTFNILHLTDPSNIIPGSLLDHDATGISGPWSLRSWVFIFLFTGLAIKLPVVPFHTWLPDAHVEAPTPISVVLAALVLKVGGYGMIRFAFPVFPEEVLRFNYWIAGLGVLSIIYGALNAMASKDVKRLIAYSSVSHMGFVLMGIVSMNAEGMNGAIFQMVSHGVLSAMLFLIAGVLYDRTGDRLIENYSGLSQEMPVYAGFTLLSFMASLGLPGLSGFIGELLVLLGAFQEGNLHDWVPQWMAFVSAFGLLLGAAYFLWTYQRMFLGTFAIKLPLVRNWDDLTGREISMLIPLAVIAFLLGLFPQLLINWLSPFSHTWVEHMRSSLSW